MICEICSKEYKNLGTHVYIHNIIPKEYYDKYLKKENEGICPTCGKETKFINITAGYFKHCSTRCSTLDPNVMEKSKNTCLKRHGVEFFTQIETSKENAKKTKLERYGNENYNNFEKVKKTNLKLYGAEFPLQNEKCMEKLKQTNLEKYGVPSVFQNEQIKEKLKQTCLEKYGVEYNFQSDIIKEKSKQSCLEKYGTEYANQSPIVKQKIKDSMIKHYGCHYFQTEENIKLSHSHESRIKGSETRRKNGNLSSFEDLMESLLIQNKILYKKEYNKDPRYPYFCDFYLQEKDIFIEIHGFWMHGGNWFDENNLEDIQTLNKWKEKAKYHPQYSVAIKTWTMRDIERRNCAKRNNLNYVVLWNKKDICEFIESYKKGCELYGRA